MSSPITKFGQWTPTATPTSVHISSIAAKKASHLTKIASSLSKVAATEKNSNTLSMLANSMRGALASLTVIDGQHFLATATATQDFPQVTATLVDATLNLQDVFNLNNLYKTNLKLVPNALFAALFGIALAWHVLLLGWSRNWYLGVCFILGSGLECVSYVMRCLAVGKEDKLGLFMAQLIGLTITPNFILAGLYFMFAQLVFVTGSRSCIIKPTLISYIYIGCDLISLFAQGAGGGISSGNTPKTAKLGADVVLGGIIFQLVAMSTFILLMINFCYRSSFNYDLSAPRTAKSFFQILFVTETGSVYKRQLDANYDQNFYQHRNKHPALFLYLPLAILVATLVVYVRCIYRVVELVEGYDGYLFRTESFLMVFDAAMLFLASIICAFFHSQVVFGKENKITAKHMRLYLKGSSTSKENLWENPSEVSSRNAADITETSEVQPNHLRNHI